jgi:hypothetical protein
MKHPEEIREQLLRSLRGAAHPEVSAALEGVPSADRGRRVAGLPHTLWQLLEHLRIAQWDILEFGRNPEHESPKFPKGYWPESDSPPSDRAWDESLRSFLADLKALGELVRDPAVDLTAPIPHLDGVTWFREILLVATHNAYHVGQVVQLRRAIGCWEG